MYEVGAIVRLGWTRLQLRYYRRRCGEHQIDVLSVAVLVIL